MTAASMGGGTGRELIRIGAPFRPPEWSALALLEGPERVGRAHANFIDAGARVITTNSCTVVPFHISEQQFAERGGNWPNSPDGGAPGCRRELQPVSVSRRVSVWW